MKRLDITVVSRAGAEFRGPRVRELYVELTGRSPVYNTMTKSWCTQTSRVSDLAALGESRGYLVVVTEAGGHR